jgi:hydrogenase maturation factor HypF (carbamoyltransferase family)
VRGKFQGIDVRPFVFQAATSLDQVVWIRNDGPAVTIEVEGPDHTTIEFQQAVRRDQPQ